MRIFAFILLTWGLILALPCAAFLATRSVWPQSGLAGALIIAFIILACGVVLGEWWARAVNAVLDRLFGVRQDTH